jgi:hypothetical protein
LSLSAAGTRISWFTRINLRHASEFVKRLFGQYLQFFRN